MSPANPNDLIRKYKRRLEKELGHDPLQHIPAPVSKEYKDFREESMPAHVSVYEKLCNQSEKIFKIKVPPKKAQEMQDNLNIAHLQITPSGAMALSYLLPLAVILFGALFSVVLFNSLFFAFFSVLIGMMLIIFLQRIPNYLANNWRLKASNQMVLCVFYVVTYMRHTSNLENAIGFASEHLSPPLSTDLKKVLWNVETEKYENVKESLDAYLDTWRKWNREFVEAFHLIESSLYETSEDRRLELLDKSLDVILQETYEKMLHYAHNLKSPITTLHMLGIILPILGLVILPLVVSFIGNVKWYHIAMLYNVLLPVIVYYMGRNILSTRPTGYGDGDVSDKKTAFKKYKKVPIKIGSKEILLNPIWGAVGIGLIFLFIGLSPLLIHALSPDFDFTLGGFSFLEYRESTVEGQAGVILGPYGIIASVFSLAIPLALAFTIGIYAKLRSKNVIKIREESKKLENEFASALFQLGNRLADGIPAEAAFGRVAEMMPETVSGQFFNVVSTNIRNLGMGLRDALFNPRTGALTYYPSTIIDSSMKVLIESIKKGPLIAAQALTNISRYIKEIHAVNERLKDLMAEIISDMKSQISFLAPAIAGIVIGITSMITTILGALGSQISKLSADGTGQTAQVSTIAQLFGDSIPTYYFQIVVGIYVVQIIYILTVISNSIENGADKLGERYAVGNNVIRSTILYCTISLIVMIVFNFIAVQIMSATVGS
jgi:Flp pilus assembly protein TadB